LQQWRDVWFVLDANGVGSADVEQRAAERVDDITSRPAGQFVRRRGEKRRRVLRVGGEGRSAVVDDDGERQ
jgi:hypothetical protein